MCPLGGENGSSISRSSWWANNLGEGEGGRRWTGGRCRGGRGGEGEEGREGGKAGRGGKRRGGEGEEGREGGKGGRGREGADNKQSVVVIKCGKIHLKETHCSRC